MIAISYNLICFKILDRIVVQVQDTVNALRSLGTVDVYQQELETADKLIADANNSRQVRTFYLHHIERVFLFSFDVCVSLFI